MPPEFLKFTEVCKRTTFSHSTLKRMVSDGRFPRPIRISPQRVAFVATDVEAWMAAQVERAV